MKNTLLAKALSVGIMALAFSASVFAAPKTVEFSSLTSGEDGRLYSDDFSLGASATAPFVLEIPDVGAGITTGGFLVLDFVFLEQNPLYAIFDITTFDSITGGDEFTPRSQTISIYGNNQVEAIFTPAMDLSCEATASCGGREAYLRASHITVRSITYDFADNTAPIPEPETSAMMLAGLGLAGWAARQRTRLSA